MKSTYRQNVRLRCGPRTRQCGGRCVPHVLNCGSQQSGNQQSVSKTVEALEDHIKDRPYESAYIVDSRSGQVLSYSTGDRFSVDIKDPGSIKGNVLTHNHPPVTSDRQSELYKGQSLSHQDVMMASAYDAKEIRAVTNTYRHSMKPKTKWPSVENLQHSYTRHYSETIADLRRGVVSGNYTHDQANAMLWHEINKRVAKEHNMVYSRTTLKGVRIDSLRCNPGNKPCGKVCVPERYKCKGNSVGSLSHPSSNLSQEETTTFEQKGKINNSRSNTKIKAAAWGIAATGTLGASVLGAVVFDLKKNVTYKGQELRIPPDGVPDAETMKAYDEFKPGDMVMRTFAIPGVGKFQHFGIYAGKEGGEHYFYSQDKLGIYIKEPGSNVKTKSTSDYIKVNDQYTEHSPISRTRAVKRAEAMLGTALSHEGLRNTCEAMARGIATDDWTTRQADKASPFTKTVVGLVAKVGLKIVDFKNGIKPLRLNEGELKRFNAAREAGQGFQEVSNNIMSFQKRSTFGFGKRRKDSDVDDFFSYTGLMNPSEFHEYAVKEVGAVPGFAGEKCFEEMVSRYLQSILAVSMIVSSGKDQSSVNSDSLDPASAAIAKKQLATVVFRIISRSYKEKIDRFLTLDISATDIITGTILSKGSVILFTINLTKQTVETRVAKDARRDSIRVDRMSRRLKKSRCNTGLPCGSTCISRNSACRLGLSQVASPGETRQIQQLTIALNEDKNPSVEEESIRDLRKRASDLGIHKYSRMSKSEMISTINAMESGSAERERLSRSLERKYEAERFTKSNALSDYAQDWNKAKKIMKIAGSGGGLTLAAAALYFYGRARSEIKKDIDNYRSGFPSMAQQAMAEEKKFRHDQVISPEHEGIIFAVGGYKGEGSSGHAIRGRLIANAGEEDASQFDKWLVERHEIRSVNLSKDYPPFEGNRMVNGKYTVEYLGYLTKNGIEGRLGDRGLLGKAFAGLTDQEKEVPRNQDAITLAAQIYAVAKSRRPGYQELDKMSEEDISSEFKAVFGSDPPSGVKAGSIRSALGQMREARGENSFYANTNKSISIIAHGQGGGTAREALEILHLMDGGAEVASRIKLITLSSPRMGLTQKRAAAEWNLTSKDDPLNDFQTQATSVNTVKNREVTSYLRDMNVRSMIADNLGFSRSDEKRQVIANLQLSLLRDLANQAKKKASKAKAMKGS